MYQQITTDEILDTLGLEDRDAFSKFGGAVGRIGAGDFDALPDALTLVSRAMELGAREMADAMCNALQRAGINVSCAWRDEGIAPRGTTLH